MTNETTRDEQQSVEASLSDEQGAELKDDENAAESGGADGAVVPSASSGKSVVDQGSVNVEVPAHALEKAVVQLQNLTVLRQQEADRQEQAIADMGVALRKQGRMNRWMLAVSLLLVAGSIGAMVIMTQLRTVNEQVSGEVQNLSGAVTATGKMVQESVEEQSRGLAVVSKNIETSSAEQAQMAAKIVTGVNETRESVTREVSKQTEAIAKVEDRVAETRQAMQKEAVATKQAVASEVGKQAEAISTVKQAVAATRAEQSKGLAKVRQEVTVSRNVQTRELAKVRNEVAAARTQNANLSKSVDAKIGKTEAKITTKVDESIAALKAERDRVQAEVKQLLEARMKLLADREIKLHGVQENLRVEEARVSKMAEEAREETRNIVGNALKKLAEIQGAPSVILGAEAMDQAQPHAVTEETAPDGETVLNVEEDAGSKGEAPTKVVADVKAASETSFTVATDVEAAEEPSPTVGATQK
ncbi:MAG: hypothetical protein GY731_05195 [Gammaproteobacteria bacterium]|nr:hypothetical protein [Gammaproteobacteria bacterium]